MVLNVTTILEYSLVLWGNSLNNLLTIITIFKTTRTYQIVWQKTTTVFFDVNFKHTYSHHWNSFNVLSWGGLLMGFVTAVIFLQAGTLYRWVYIRGRGRAFNWGFTVFGHIEALICQWSQNYVAEQTCISSVKHKAKWLIEFQEPFQTGNRRNQC